MIWFVIWAAGFAGFTIAFLDVGWDGWADLLIAAAWPIMLILSSMLILSDVIKRKRRENGNRTRDQEVGSSASDTTEASGRTYHCASAVGTFGTTEIYARAEEERASENLRDLADRLDAEVEAEEREGEIIGWRAWRLMKCENFWWPHLHSWGVITTHIGEKPETCWQGPTLSAHEKPCADARSVKDINSWDALSIQWAHGSGIYAMKEMGSLDSLIVGSQPEIYGQVALHGLVREHEQGYRAEHARVEKLFLRSGSGRELELLKDLLERQYHCDVELV